jgi:hypothetical protein
VQSAALLGSFSGKTKSIGYGTNGVIGLNGDLERQRTQTRASIFGVAAPSPSVSLLVSDKSKNGAA